MYTLAQTHQIEPLKEVNFLLCRLRFSKAVQNVHGGSSFCPGVASCFRRRRAEVGLVIAVLFVCVKPQCLLPPKPTAGEQGAATGVRGLSETASPVACLVWCRPTSRFLVLKRTVRALAGLRREVGCACERGSRCPPGDRGNSCVLGTAHATGSVPSAVAFHGRQSLQVRRVSLRACRFSRGRCQVQRLWSVFTNSQ